MNIPCKSKVASTLAATNCRYQPAKSILRLSKNENAVDCTLISARDPRSKATYNIAAKNIEAIHSRLLKEGKISITFKSPPQILMLSDANPSHLSLLIATIRDPKHFLSLDLTPSKQSKSLQPKADVKSMTVTSLKNYPSLTGVGFPKTLVSLTISNLNYRHLDMRICALTKLQTLDLSHNKLRKLPLALWRMESLSSINISHNLIPELPDGIRPSDPLCVNLTSIDLSSNALSSFPYFLRFTSALRILKLSANPLNIVPNFIRSCTRTLRVLELESCNLRNLPAALSDCYLDELNLASNPFPPPVGGGANEVYKDTHHSQPGAVGSLLSQSVKSLVRHGVPVEYTADQLLPDHLVSYARSGQHCRTCRRLLLENCVVFYEHVQLKSIARQFSRLDQPAVMTGFACSNDCFRCVTAGKKVVPAVLFFKQR